MTGVQTCALPICDVEFHLKLCADSVEPAWDSLCLSLSLSLSLSKRKREKPKIIAHVILKNYKAGGTRAAQSVKHLTSAQLMISWFVSLSPALGSMLTAQSLEPALNSVSPSFSLSLK